MTISQIDKQPSALTLLHRISSLIFLTSVTQFLTHKNKNFHNFSPSPPLPQNHQLEQNSPKRQQEVNSQFWQQNDQHDLYFSTNLQDQYFYHSANDYYLLLNSILCLLAIRISYEVDGLLLLSCCNVQLEWFGQVGRLLLGVGRDERFGVQLRYAVQDFVDFQRVLMRQGILLVSEMLMLIGYTC